MTEDEAGRWELACLLRLLLFALFGAGVILLAGVCAGWMWAG